MAQSVCKPALNCSSDPPCGGTLTIFQESIENPASTAHCTPAATARPTGVPGSEKFSANFPGPVYQLPPWAVFESLTLKEKIDHAALHLMNFVKHHILYKTGEVDLNDQYDQKMHSALGGILHEYVASKREKEYQHKPRKPFLGLESVAEIYEGSSRAKSRRPYAKRTDLAGELVDFVFGGGHPISVLVALMFVVNLKESNTAIQTATGLKAQNSNGKRGAKEEKKQVIVCVRCTNIPTCGQTDCSNQPCFNFKEEAKPVFCSRHKVSGMVNVTKAKKKQVTVCVRCKNRPTCGQTDCSSQPFFNFKEETKPVFCSRHKALGMVNVVTRRCEHDGCFAQKRFNYPGLKRAVVCRLHKLEGMVDRYKRFCEENGCEKIPNCNFPGDKRGLFCAQHKAEGMVNVLISRCEHIGCEKMPSFKFEDKPGRRFCGNHKMTGMVDVTRKNGCKQQGCFKRPYFCPVGEPKASFCEQHKQDSMIDLRKKKMQIIGSSFNDNDDSHEDQLTGFQEQVDK